jgi:hypothetical protein
VLDVRFDEKIALALEIVSSAFHGTQFGNRWLRALK